MYVWCLSGMCLPLCNCILKFVSVYLADFYIDWHLSVINCCMRNNLSFKCVCATLFCDIPWSSYFWIDICVWLIATCAITWPSNVFVPNSSVIYPGLVILGWYMCLAGEGLIAQSPSTFFVSGHSNSLKQSLLAPDIVLTRSMSLFTPDADVRYCPSCWSWCQLLLIC